MDGQLAVILWAGVLTDGATAKITALAKARALKALALAAASEAELAAI